MQRNSGRIMAEFEKQARKARAAGSLRVPHPKEAKIRQQNAERLQKVPKRKPRKSADVSFGAIAKMLKSLSFDPREIEFFRQSGFETHSGSYVPPPTTTTTRISRF
jgi:hypothetical protein